MRVQAVAVVLEHSAAQGTDRLVLLVPADHAGTAPTRKAQHGRLGDTA